MRKTVYIAAQYGAATAEERARNAARARWLATVAHRMGLAPVYVHDAIEVGVFGDDADPKARNAGLASATAIAASCLLFWAADADYAGQRINLTLAPRFSAGVNAELEAWEAAHPKGRPVAYNWTRWRDYAAFSLREDCPPWPG